MLQMCRVGFLFCLLGLVGKLSCGQTHPPMGDEIRVKTHVVGQQYCRADSDLFTVSLKLDIEVFNSSKAPIHLAPRMIPWVAKVAASAKDAESEHYLYEITTSHYVQDTGLGARLRIEPGKTATLHTGYDLIARYHAAFTYPKSLSSGNYAVVLVLRPEMEQPGQHADPQAVENVTTDAFLIRVPQHPKVIDCDRNSGSKSNP